MNDTNRVRFLYFPYTPKLQTSLILILPIIFVNDSCDNFVIIFQPTSI